ncbi:MAG TPA: DUF2203 domain-containing protein [Bryobacteraceae bacterium]|jgi:hypothetical protein|nr:DUF2203 domain-containing protein [Bryobacteraceae bacterium]
MPRYFTLTEARALLPTVGRLIRESVNSKARYQEGEDYMRDLSRRILMLGGVAVDTAAAEAWKSQRDTNAQTLKQSLEKIEEIGVLVKDLDIGLVDFPTLYRGEEVYLCWRMDEDDIDRWHGIHEGFAGRKEIDRDFLDNHRGEPIA